MNFLASLQQALGWLGNQAAQAWDVASAAIANRPEPAGRVAVYTLVMLALAFVAPKIIKKVSR